MGKRDEWGQMYRALEEAGYEVRLLPSGHCGVFKPDGARVYTLCATASDRRSYLNACSGIHRLLGVDVRKGKR